jgi:multiple sugar transport system substrate-binding protein
MYRWHIQPGIYRIRDATVGETPAADPSGIAEVNEAFASAGNSVLYGQLTSKEAAKQFREKANAILERNNAQ